MSCVSCPGSETSARRGLRPVRLATALLLLALLTALVALAAASDAGAASIPARVTVTPTAFSPNGDGVKDRLTVRVRLTKRVRLFVGVYSPSGKLVTTLHRWRTRSKSTRTFRWSGRVSGHARANGRYTVKVKVKVAGRTRTISRKVTLDTVAPTVDIGDVTSGRVFGGATTRFPYVVTGETPASVELQVYTAPGVLGGGGQRKARVTTRAQVRTGTIGWSGKNSSGYLETGQYKFRFIATDKAGNSGRTRFDPVTVWAPRKITGTVRTATGTAVSKATVRVEGTSLTTTTATNGSFTFANCPMGFRIFNASKKGLPSARRRLSVNLGTGTVDLVLGETSLLSRTYTRDDDSEVTISGRLYFKAEDGVTDIPMRDVRVLLQDHAFSLLGLEFFDDLEETETRTDQDGDFSITYDYDEIWDSWDEPDVRVIAYAEDGGEEVCAVYWDEASPALWPYQFSATGWWDNNTSDHTGLVCRHTGSQRVAWFVVDCMQRAHDRWKGWTGWDRSSVDVVYPEDLGETSGTYSWFADSIDLAGHSVWDARTSYHEYGHALHNAAYDLPGVGVNIFDAYSDSTRLHNTWVPAKGRWYTYQGGGDYRSEGEGGSWIQFKEGFAEYFAALMSDCDQGGMDSTLERDVDHPDVDDARCMHSVSRVLWDLTDDASTKLYSIWEAEVTDRSACGPVDRLPNLYGSGDDDRMQGWGTAPHGATFTKVWKVLHEDWPANVRELRDDLYRRYGNDSLDRRGFDAILYRMGIDADDITENIPHVDAGTVLLTGIQNADDSYRGTLKLWCHVTDPDALYGDPDIDHVKVRFEGRYQVGSSFTNWAPIGWTLAPSGTPPPGRSGDDWYSVLLDTTLPSPVELMPCVDTETGLFKLYDFDLNRMRDQNVITAGTTGGTCRRDRMWVRAIAFDDLAESPVLGDDEDWQADPAVSDEFAVDNSPGVFGGQAQSDDGADVISWPGMYTITSTPYTYELFFTPLSTEGGTIAQYTFSYPNAGCRAPVMRLEMTADGYVSFSINKSTGAGPGGGLWCDPYYPKDRTVLEVGRRYHIAVQDGSQGLRLYINGRLEAAAPYFDYPQPDWSDGTLAGGWFSIGDYETLSAEDTTAAGCYDEVRVSDVQRYGADFEPPAGPFTADAHTMLLDHLDGSTTGTNEGFSFLP